MQTFQWPVRLTKKHWVLILTMIGGVLFYIGINYYSYLGAEERDAQRLRDIQTIRYALEAFYGDYGHYPQIEPPPRGVQEAVWGSISSSEISAWENVLGAKLAPYLTRLPVDPINNGTDLFYKNKNEFTYLYTNQAEGTEGFDGVLGNGQTYDLIVRLEHDNPSMCKYRRWLVYSLDNSDYNPGDSWCDTRINSEGENIFSAH